MGQLPTLSFLFLAPSNPAIDFRLASIHQTGGEIDLAIDVYERGLLTKANAVPLLNNLALLYLETEDGDKATIRAMQALELAPADPNVLDTVGWVHTQVREFDKAIPYLERAAEMRPEIAEFRYHLGLSYYQVGRTEDAARELTFLPSAN